MKNQKGFTIIELLVLIVILAGIGGWITNIYKLSQTVFQLEMMVILRLIGIPFAPLGAVLGYF